MAVIDYAINQLGFDESDIVLYGWSIGGFSVVYGATHYSNLKGLYLDATFDDVMPLAEHVMPPMILPITTKTIRFVNFCSIFKQISQYRTIKLNQTVHVYLSYASSFRALRFQF